MAYSLLTDCWNAFTNLFSLIGFSTGLFSVMSSSKSKLDKKYDSKLHQVQFHKYSLEIFSKTQQRCRDIIFYFSKFVIVKIHELPQLVISFCSLAKLMVYVNNKILNINRNFFGSLSRQANVLNDEGNKCPKSSGHLPYFVFLKEAATLSNHRIGIIRRISYTVVPVK